MARSATTRPFRATTSPWIWSLASSPTEACDSLRSGCSTRAVAQRSNPTTSRCVTLDQSDVGHDGLLPAPGDLAIVNVTPVRAAGRGYGVLRSSDSLPTFEVAVAERFSSVNFARGMPPDPNLSVAVIGADGAVCYDGAVSAHDVVLDLVGAVSAVAVRQVAPERLVDTRPTSPSCTSPLELDRSAMSNGVPRRFTDDEFQRLVDLTSSAGIRRGTPPSITGDQLADARIRGIAEARGYRQRSDIGWSGLVAVGSHLVDPGTAAAFRSLQRSASAAGYAIQVGSGYRSVARQRAIFVSKLNGRGISVASVRSGRADAAIDSILQFSSIPGYSRHHTGTTIDLSSGGSGINGFGATAAFRWLAADNFAVAKRHGFVPSYPAGAGLQGPRPEPWEFVHVGTAALLESNEFGSADASTLVAGRLTIVGTFARSQQTIEVFVDDARVARTPLPAASNPERTAVSNSLLRCRSPWRSARTCVWSRACRRLDACSAVSPEPRPRRERHRRVLPGWPSRCTTPAIASGASSREGDRLRGVGPV